MGFPVLSVTAEQARMAVDIFAPPPLGPVGQVSEQDPFQQMGILHFCIPIHQLGNWEKE